MKRRQPLGGFGFTVLAIMVVMLATTFNRQNYNGKITAREFLIELEAGNVASTTLKPNKGTPMGELILFIEDGKERQLYRSDVGATETFLLEHGISYKLKNVPQENYLLTIALPIIISAMVLAGLFILIDARAAGGGGTNARMINFGRSRAEMSKEVGKINFKRMTGLREEKEDLEELVGFLRNPQKYIAVGARIPKGVILVGPPGTGKTLLAKAMTGEAGMPFFSISGSDFAEMFVGVDASRARDLFEETKKNVPCIVFIGEIDAVARRRGTGMGGGRDERERTLNQLLVKMDGSRVNEGIIVMAATSRVDTLDPAILRPRRFDRKIGVSQPDVKGWKEIPEVHFREKPSGEDVDLSRMTRIISGFTGVDSENLPDETAIVAAREGRKFVQQADTDRSFTRVGIGARKHSKVISEKEKKITAYHEAGHVVLFRVLPNVGPVHTISIISTGMGVAGYAMPLPENDGLFNNRGKMLRNVMVSLGGRTAEEIILDDVITRASQDIRQATSIAWAMVTKYGVPDKVGMINYDNDGDEVFIGRDLAHTKSYGEHMVSVIDSEMKRIIDERYEKARVIIQEHASVLYRCMELLIEKEKIGQEEFESLFE